MKKISVNVTDGMYEDILKLKAQSKQFDLSETIRMCIHLGIKKYENRN